MRRFVVICCTLVSLACSNWALGQKIGLIDRPTPPPCAADGTCYPKTEEWGYYPGRWRTWPGVSLEPVPAPTQGTADELGPELTPHETPPAELEDRAAPPSSPRRRPPALPVPPPPEDEGEAAPAESQPTEPTTPPAVSPLGQPSSDADPPPAFPLSMSGQMRSGHSETSRSRIPDGHNATPAQSTSASDPPPTPPWNHRAGL